MNNPLYINRICLHPKIGRCDVTFRQGLNVVISEDVVDNLENIDESKQDNLNNSIHKESRNSTGKTTFVHLIDYSLGKEFFIDNENSENKSLFEGVHVLLELSINGNKYTVTRSMLDADSIIVYFDWVAQSIIEKKDNKRIYKKVDLKGYISFLELEIFNGKNYFKDKRISSYRSIMNFIIRDQFYGFTNYYSGLKVEGADVSRERLDFLFGLATPEKLQVKEDIRVLEKDKKQIINEHGVLKKYLLEILKDTKTSINNTIKENKNQIDMLENEFNKCNNELIFSERANDKLKEMKDILMEKYKKLSDDITVIESRILNYGSTLNEIDNELNKVDHISISMDVLNPFKYTKCPIFMKDISSDKSNNINCPLVDNSEYDKNNQIIEARKRLIEYEKKDLQNALKYLRNQVEELVYKRNSLRKDIDDINLKIGNKRDNIISSRDNLMNQIKELEYRNKTLENHISQYEYLENLQKKKKEKSSDIKIKKAELEKVSSDIIYRISEIYNEIVVFLSRSTREGAINNQNLEPLILFENGQLDTGAGMRSIAIIAFDLAMLTFSLENGSKQTYIPYMNFLVHDSPKRNDIDVEMYKRVFDYVINLENVYLPLNTGFQYIITTLDISKSVSDFKEKYIRLALDNSGDGGKLFGVKINI